MKMTSIKTWLLAGLGCASVGLVQAQDARSLQQQSLAATCSSCHGTEGRAVSNAAVPGLAGMPAIYMVEQMKSFKSGTRTVTVMNHIAKGYSDAQIDMLAAYFSALKK